MDLSVRRVLEALAPGPATVGILSTRYGMGLDEAEEALAHCLEEGLVREVPPLAFEATAEGRVALACAAAPDTIREGERVMARLAARDRALHAFDR